MYSLDDEFTNPYQIWTEFGRPFPNVTKNQIDAMRNASNLHQTRIIKLNEQVTLDLTTAPKVTLIQFCSDEHLRRTGFVNTIDL